MSDFEEEVDLLEEEFSRATKFIERGHDQFEQKELLKFYAFYKQATSGKCDVPKPGIFNMAGRAKWTAWNELGDLSKPQAMQGYVQHLTQLKPSWDQSSEDDSEYKPQKGSWVSVSTFAHEEDTAADKTLVDFIKEGNLPQLEQALANPEVPALINELDDDGLGLIHWAADRGNEHVLKLILAVPGRDLDLRDSGGQTALHYASSCGNRDCVRVLVEAGADKSAKDDEGESVEEVAFDAAIKELLNHLPPPHHRSNGASLRRPEMYLPAVQNRVPEDRGVLRPRGLCPLLHVQKRHR
ncbi:acyl-CoA-binding domain-containing protein 6 [Culex pipiens pallens]|uniref:acyl-CoA-binding domain-containing protein 6 n=1 Tax=Culex pipiens pallens TaxID=42434 RepID=UPI0022AAFBC3|nr:acyl-CoA-binding domain-containing protein 6 [Culex pipiens pallens]